MVNKRFIRILLVLLLTFVVGAVFLQLIFIFSLNRKIRNHVESEVANLSGGVYEFKINRLSVNLFNQSIRIKDFYLKSNDEQGGDLPKMIVSADEVNLLKFNLFRFFLGKKLLIRRVELKNSSGNIYRTVSESNSLRNQRFSIHQLFRKYFDEIHIREIDINDADLKFFKEKTHTKPLVVSKNNHLRISNLKINKSIEESGSFFKADSLYLEINSVSFLTTDGLYTVSVKKIRASHSNSELTIDSFRMIPNYSKKEFASKAGGQTDRFVVTAPNISFTGIDVNAFFERFWFVSASAKVKGLDISAYRDKNDTRKPGKSPSVKQLLNKIPFYTVIDSVRIENALITYEEVAEGAELPGEIYFNNIFALLTGITNDSAYYSKYSRLELSSSSKLMNEGQLTVKLQFPLNTEKMVFNCSGKLIRFPMKAMNLMLTPTEKISINSGIIDSMIFSFHANNEESRGEMKLVYNNLKMEFLNKNNRKGIIQNLLTFFTHQLIIKENNPEGENPVRITPIRYRRDPSRFVFNYSWKSLLSGIKPAIGIPDRSLKKERRKEK